MTWRKLIRIVIKAAIFFTICNLLWIPVSAFDLWGRVSIYNTVVPGRGRLPYGENPAESYNLSLTSIPAMLASHEINRPKAEDEFRVVVIGDSSTWGWLLEHDQTVAAQLEALGYMSEDGRRVEVYNLGYPGMSLVKDVIILYAATQQHQVHADAVIWLVTAQSFPESQQVELPIVQNNHWLASRATYEYESFWHGNIPDPPSPRMFDSRFVQSTSILDSTLVGRRREIADWMRLQVYGFAWVATDVDQAFSDEITLRQSDFEADTSWFNYDQSQSLTDLAFDPFEDAGRWSSRIPLLIVNEPIYISSGENSDVRYNSFYPRWAYDQYLELLSNEMQGRNYLDLWDAIPPDEFTDTPVHLTPEGTRMLAERIGAELESIGVVRR